MEWTDEGIILGLRRYGESSAIFELMTANHGRHLGLVRGGASRRQAPHLQPGTVVRATWRARLDAQLGTYALEPLHSHVDRLLSSGTAAYAFSHLGALLRLLPERDPHPGLHAVLDAMMALLDAPRPAAMMIARFELLMLQELGFGLELDRCAATGGRNDLLYVSPRTGRAVSGEAGEPWRGQLLDLPYFLIGDVAEPPGQTQLDAAFELTGFFLRRRVLEPRGLAFSDARAAFLATVGRG
ncbi:DNA repair protein RecO [Ancylobacter sp. 6x-1]|uniref:DNA repair protein RecO n=1 Tax=Ancylobacter crimeensis TaxID=2579147 RepID=A0ABT0D6U9_9HYPH|nr:DNA repair protein RecO [Ancylobacter crimeensis]MCK0195683.1 DNA repair protein RecO [Ancylobacter crimeensis]